jgi:hypothetical protein
MTTSTLPPTARPTAPPWLRDLADARTYYEETFGWPVILDIEPHRIVIPAGDVLDAITMSAGLGEAVLTELRIEMLAGPVITDASGEWWTFLTMPVIPPRPDVPSDLRGLGVAAVPPGDHVIVPNRDGAAGSPRWIERPRRRHCLQPRSVVIGTTRRVAARRAASRVLSANQ